MTLSEKLLVWLAADRRMIGEIQVETKDGGYHLCHFQDIEIADLKSYNDPEDAIEIGKYDPAGKYRPLRTAPTLARGWQMLLLTPEAVVRALDFFYPAMLGTYFAWENGTAAPVNFRDTVNRQTGMYRVAGKITNEQADTLIVAVCDPKNCLKTIVWQVDGAFPLSQTPPGKTDPSHDLLERGRGFIPMLCEECCNILVAAARETVKKLPSSTPTPTPSPSAT